MATVRKDQNFTILSDTVKSILKGENINLVNISTLLINLMQSVEQINGLTGDQKKDLVIEVIKYTIDKSSIPDDEKQILYIICYTTIPEIINVIISTVNNEFNLKKIESSCIPCLKFY